jgi:putative radical SAM enzyme (TIGR03279 family)
MPPGLRSSLYIKDDDYMQSFLHGNFITLTNLADKDIKKIVSHMMEPLHISVHSLDPEIRKKIFGKEDYLISLKHLKTLDEAGLHTNIQIVYMPGINDGEDLKNTITGLISGYENIQSIGVVPVGITRFNRESELISTDKRTAGQVISIMDKLIERHGKYVSDKVFLSDEFYLISGKELPPFKSYKDFFQINNGIGKSVDFLNNIKTHLDQKKDFRPSGKTGVKKILIISSDYGAIIIKKAVKMLSGLSCNNTIRYENVFFDIKAIKNDFFGGNVKVTGLLTGSDLLSNIDLKKIKDYTSVLIPDSIFNDEGLTLDGHYREDIDAIGDNINIIGEDGKSFITALDNIAGV